SVPGGAEGMSRLIDVVANGVEVAFVDGGNDPVHLTAPLPAKAISRLTTPVASVKSVSQPYASFSGSPAESDDALRMRTPERLRHKDRCITPWDYERVVLGAFPGINRVKCIPHAKRGNFRAPGNVLLVVIPDLRNTNARDPLR